MRRFDMKYVRKLVLCGGFALIAAIAIAQDNTGHDALAQGKDGYSISLVKEYIEASASTGIRIGYQDRQMWRLGDRVSIALLKLHKADELSDPKVIRGFLPAIHVAFENPKWIEIKEDRSPLVTLFFLTSLVKDAQNTSLKKDI